MNVRAQMIAFITIVRKEIRRFSRIWLQTILPPIITTTLYFVIFGRMIGDRIGPMAGYSYMDYIVPGVILMSVINNAYSNVVSSFYGSKFGRHVEELLIAPVPNYLILLGYVTGGVARALIVGVAVALVASLFTDLHIHHLGVTIAVALMTAILFALGGFINAVYAQSFDDIAIIPTFILTPLTYLGGVFYSIDMLPQFWQNVSQVNPILYMVNAFRYGLLGTSDIALSTAFGLIIGFIALLYGYCIVLLRRGTGLRS